MISRKTNLKAVCEVQQEVEKIRDTLLTVDPQDPRYGTLLDMYTDLLELRAKVEEAEMKARRRGKASYP
jgi:predicted amino acid racemase